MLRGVEPSVAKQVLREHEQDGRIDALRNGGHHVGGKHPEHVVDEQSREEDGTGLQRIKSGMELISSLTLKLAKWRFSIP